MKLPSEVSIREHSVFLEKFEDGSVYYAAKTQWPENAKKSLAWAKAQKRQRPLVEKYLKFNGHATRQIVASNLSQQEAELIKSNLIRRSVQSGEDNLNILKETNIVLSVESSFEIQNYCHCGQDRADTLVSIFKSIK
ncbi:hypothetical protein [Vibrio sp. ABG19]|uniref:hypothetical protein n=1 Tax=Vibrio sp. ABG19 TaxID=2817385 RepID=UPI00249E942D|nr:hypothetical protein [Vibrio sp. ABG19]WGY45047.1 hypothetical protein J0X00_04915 [Vibrio sp. ABG19]